MGQLFTINELSRLISVSRQKITKWIQQEGLPVLKRTSGQTKSREYIYIDSEIFWEWIRGHKEFVSLLHVSSDAIPNEPYWIKYLRKKQQYNSQ